LILTKTDILTENGAKRETVYLPNTN